MASVSNASLRLLPCVASTSVNFCSCRNSPSHSNSRVFTGSLSTAGFPSACRTERSSEEAIYFLAKPREQKGRKFRLSGPPRGGKRSCVRMQKNEERGPQASGGANDSAESLFMKELRRRGMSRTSEKTGTGSGKGGEADGRGRSTEGSGWDSNVKSPPRFTSDSGSRSGGDPGQLEKTRLLNSEGLEGFPTRAWELIRLGGLFPLYFWPLSLALIAAFVSMYLYFGTSFVHSGQKYRTPSGAPPYVEPYELLETERLPSFSGPSRVPYNPNIPSETY